MSDIKFKIHVENCPSCGRKMMHKDNNKIFPKFFKEDQSSQMIEHEISYISESAKIDGEEICIICEKEGKSSFLCILCGDRKPSDKLQESIGDPAECLCQDCYETTPAKLWVETEKKLWEKHRYDYE